MIEPKLLEILVCPQCKGEVTYTASPEELVCQKCKLAYTVKENIPVMLVEEARKL